MDQVKRVFVYDRRSHPDAEVPLCADLLDWPERTSKFCFAIFCNFAFF